MGSLFIKMLIESIKFNTKFPPLELDSKCFGLILIRIVSTLSLKFYSDVFIIEESMRSCIIFKNELK